MSAERMAICVFGCAVSIATAFVFFDGPKIENDEDDIFESIRFAVVFFGAELLLQVAVTYTSVA